MKHVRKTEGLLWKSSPWPKLKRFQQEHKKSCAICLFSLFLYSSHGVVWPRSRSQTQTLQLPGQEFIVWSQPGVEWRERTRLWTTRDHWPPLEDATVNTRRPLASFTGRSYSPTPASCSHTGSVLSDFPVFQERLTFRHEISQYWEECTKRVQLWTCCVWDGCDAWSSGD